MSLLPWTFCALHTDLSNFSICIMGFSRFWLIMADKEIKVHHRVIRMKSSYYLNGKIRKAGAECLSVLRQCRCRICSWILRILPTLSACIIAVKETPGMVTWESLYTPPIMTLFPLNVTLWRPSVCPKLITCQTTCSPLQTFKPSRLPYERPFIAVKKQQQNIKWNSY